MRSTRDGTVRFASFLAVFALVFSFSNPVHGQGNGQGNSQGNSGCISVDSNLTAYKVNQSVIGETIKSSDHGCDVAVYFDKNAPRKARVKNAEIIQDTAPNSTGNARISFGVFIDGTDVDVEDSTFESAGAGQYLSIGYQNGATGEAVRNDLTGHHRVGILADGKGTDVLIRNNEVTGTGPQTGWAENGIQVSRGANASVRNNTTKNHWWDGKAYCSSGVIIYGSDKVKVHRNNAIGNDCGISVLAGDKNDVKGNWISVKNKDATVRGISGVWVDGESFGLTGAGNDRVVNNTIIGHPADMNQDVGGPAKYGVQVEDTQRTKVINNTIRDFETRLFTEDDDVVQANFDPAPANP